MAKRKVRIVSKGEKQKSYDKTCGKELDEAYIFWNNIYEIENSRKNREIKITLKYDTATIYMKHNMEVVFTDKMLKVSLLTCTLKEFLIFVKYVAQNDGYEIKKNKYNGGCDYIFTPRKIIGIKSIEM